MFAFQLAHDFQSSLFNNIVELHDGAAPPSSAYKADVIAGILMEHLVETRALQHAANLNTNAFYI